MQSHEKQTAFLSQICNELDINIFMTTYYTHINRLIATKTQQLLLIHDMIPENLGYTMNPMWQQKHRAIRSATRIICISQSTSADVKRYFADVPAARENIVIYNAFDRNIWQWTPLSSTSKSAATTSTTETIAKVLIMSSNTDNYKGLSIIIDMIRKFSARFPAKSWEFHFICSKPPGYVNPPHVNVIFHGSNNSLTNIEIAEIYRNATVILYPTGAEGFGLPILEAAYLQIPIITRALPVFLELFDGYPDMIADTPEAFYRKLMELSRTKFRLNDEK
jgi:glycosyltransferase involved in cell wall biosynthesis